MTAKKATPRKPKQEVLDEFEDLVEEVKTKERPSAKDKAQKTARAEAVKSAVADLAADKVVAKVASVGLEVTRKLSQVSEELVQQTQELDLVREAVRLAKEELEQLHGVDTAATAVEYLIADYEEKAAKLEEAIEAKKAQWAEEEARYNKAQFDRKQLDESSRKRELDEYTYRTTQERKKADDAFQENLRQRLQEEKIRQEELQRQWQQREAALTASEKELQDLRAQVATFPARVDAEVKKAEAIVGNTVKREYEHKIQLLTKDQEAAANMAKLQIQSHAETIAKQAATIEALQQRLALSDSKVQSIAEKALDSASERRALAEITQMATRDSAPSARNKS